MEQKFILTSISEGILTVTIKRPDKLNALNKEVLQQLDSVINQVYIDKNILSVIITGSGTKSFVAGADIAEFEGLGKEEGKLLSEFGQTIFNKIENCPKPIIACVNGYALGGGCELAMSCHLRIASFNAKFGQPEINLGLIPGYGGTQRLPGLIGKGRALELLLTGTMLDATKALEYGLVNYVVEQPLLLDKGKELLMTIQSKSTYAVTACLNLINQNTNSFELESSLFGKLFETSDMKEGVGRFLGK